MTAILHITDTHIVAEGKMVSGKLDAADTLQWLVARLYSIRDQIGSIDAVLITGDLGDDGIAQGYARFLDLMAPLDLPFHATLGSNIVETTAFKQFGSDQW
ncbi:metallophosphoesterase [Loktanella sp. Alg231-35]|uniref:metallophosphoesterase n=1 Tax=Loktanella sp. Alg231-35 TaxID=1922220 RepID=UPI000D54CCC0|nr:metallophosphoesterase [Loktanella sp. Alg231-35]